MGALCVFLEQAARRLHRQGALGNLLASSQNQVLSGHSILAAKPPNPTQHGGGLNLMYLLTE